MCFRGARPALTRDHLLVPRNGRIAVFDRNGRPAESGSWTLGRYQAGNLTCFAGIASSVRQGSLDVLFDAQALLRQIGRAHV